MAKRKNQPLIESDSDTSGSESGSDMDSEFLSLAKKKKTAGDPAAAAAARSGSDSDWGGAEDGKNGAAASSSTAAPDNAAARKRGAKKMTHSSSESDSESGSGSSSGSDSSDSSDDDDDDEHEAGANDSAAAHSTAAAPAAVAVAANVAPVVTTVAPQQQPTPAAAQQSSVAVAPMQTAAVAPTQPAAVVQQRAASDIEDGEVNSSGGEEDADEDDDDDDDDDDSSSSCESEFNDGFDDNLMGDSTDRARLEALTEKEREQEIFKRIEERDRKRTHWEIKRKLRLKAERERDTTITPAEKKLKAERKLRKKKARQARVARQAAARAREEAAEAAAAAAAAAKAKAAAMAPPVAVEQAAGSATSTQANSADRNGASSMSTASATADSQAVSDEENWDDEPEFADPKERSKERKKTVEANRTDDKRSNAMAMLKARREGKMKRDEEEAKRQAEREQGDKEEIDGIGGSKSSSTKLKASDVYSDDSGSDSDSDTKRSHKRSSDSNRSDSDSDRERDPSKKQSASGGAASANAASASSSAAKRAQAFITTKDELNKIRLSRHKVERFVALPHFGRVVAGCFVRISIGNKNNQPVYRVAEVAGVVETAKIYLLGKCRTNKGLRLRFGTSEKVFRLEFLSNQDFSDTEFEKWKEVCAQNSCVLPTQEFVDRKVAEIKEAIVYEFKDEDVHRIIEEKNRFRKYPTNYAMKKTTLMKERDAALLRGEDDAAAEINVQIEELDDRANELDKRRSSTISLISYINDRNRKRNVQEAEKAIMEEVRASKGVRADDPFTRRCTKPTMMFKSRDPATDVPSVPMIPLAGPGAEARKAKEEAAARNAAAMENNLYSLHDFEIDLDVVLPVNPVTQPKPVTKSADSAPKRSLNLEAYKKKRGLI